MGVLAKERMVLMIEEMLWLEEAACKGKPTSMFFPERPTNGVTSPLAEIKAALAICGECQVVKPCLDYAMERKEPGIWGATTENERRKMKSMKRRERAAKGWTE